MLTVAGSGLIGRYIYAHIHHGLYGRKLELGELRESAENLHGQAGISFLPELAARLDAAEQQVLQAGARLSLLGFFKPLTVALMSARLRWGLQAYVRRACVPAHASHRLSLHSVSACAPRRTATSNAGSPQRAGSPHSKATSGCSRCGTRCMCH